MGTLILLGFYHRKELDITLLGLFLPAPA